MPTQHLDLGCGDVPRNPYKRDVCFACDVRDPAEMSLNGEFEYRQANLVLNGIPFPDNFFDSVSAYDFIEHMPRQIINHNGNVIFPFINLMNEIYRVLKPRGLFLAVTPAFPRSEAFQDPTHVNIITEKTHEYFSGAKPYAAIYGYNGRFEVKTVEWSARKNFFIANTPWWRKRLRNLNHRLSKAGLSHLVWELEAKK